MNAPLAIVGGTLVDGRGGAPLESAAMLINGATIADVGPTASVLVPPDARIIDARGWTLIPGLIDSHVHIDTSGGGGVDRGEFTPEAQHNNFRAYLRCGVTTIVSLGTNPNLDSQKAALESGELLGPRLFGSKMSITAPNSHPLDLLKAFGIYDRVMRSGLLQILDSPEEARAAVRKAAELKSDVLKIYHSRTQFPGTLGFDVDREKLRLDVLQAVIDEASACKLRVFAHTALPGESKEAVAAGVDALAHTIGLAESGVDEVVEMMAKRGVFMTSTLVRCETYYSLRRDPFFAETWKGKASPTALGSLAHPGSQLRLRHLTPGLSNDAQRYSEVLNANLRRAVRAGVKVAMGTDSGAPGTVHGASSLREMELMHLAGMTPMQAIEAATRVAAEMIGKADSLGTLEKGKLADIAAVEGDPLRDISRLRNLRLVVRNGIAIDPEDIQYLEI